MRFLLMLVKVFLAAFLLTAVAVLMTRWYLQSRYPAEAGIPPPPAGRAGPAPSAPDTVVSLPLSVPVEALQETLEKYVPLTYRDEDEDPTDLLIGDHILYDLRRGKLSIGVTENGFSFSFPVPGLESEWQWPI